MSGAQDTLALVIGGQRYTGWTEMSLETALDQWVSSFDLTVTERWPTDLQPILPFTPVQIFIGPELAFTGYVDVYAPSLAKDKHEVKLTGRSKTCDLVDCSPNVPAGQYSGYTVAAIARALGGIFSLGVAVETGLADAIIPDASISVCETAFEFLDRLATVAGMLVTDDEAGDLVLTTAGATRSTTHLVQGQNILEVSAEISGAELFSEYIVQGQAGLAASIGASGQTTPGQASVQTGQIATAIDTTVPRYRPKVWMAESATGQASIQVQALWHMNYAQGRAVKATLTVTGWRQDDGTLWRKNQMVAITAPYIGVDQDLLIFSVARTLSKDDGRRTTLTLTPPQAAQPNPRKLRQRRGKHGRGRHGSGINWDGAGGE